MRRNILTALAAGLMAAISGEREQVRESSPTLTNLGGYIVNSFNSMPNRRRKSYGINEMSRHKQKMKCRLYCRPKK